MKISDRQNLVINRTGRVEIPSSFVKRRVEQGRIVFAGLHEGPWLNDLDPRDLDAAVLYLDINSLFLTDRHVVARPRDVFGTGWDV